MMGYVLDGVELKPSNQQRNFLDGLFTSDKVRRVVFDMGPMKALGEVGLRALFYQKYRDTIGSSVTLACLRCLNDCESLEAMNSTLIMLIPKVTAPEHITKFRPISLCNVLYKIITNTLANRLCLALGEIVKLLKKIIDDYMNASGHLVNYSKSTMCESSSVGQGESVRLATILGFHVVVCHDRYLGLQCFVGRNKRKLFVDIVDIVWNRLKSWQDKFLSMGGKEILIKTVVQSISKYSMSLFHLPKGENALVNQLKTIVEEWDLGLILANVLEEDTVAILSLPVVVSLLIVESLASDSVHMFMKYLSSSSDPEYAEYARACPSMPEPVFWSVVGLLYSLPSKFPWESLPFNP
ncbi:hypothetical protein Dsin_018313 [Dipteronia sinensis]|uniref:Uncharacterized protein n=1 Tax=Dipteronia sinensis TaxID=43782 RepID=A0AAE0E1I4_9ROSI|nr:hypothetical protein Dsin_018313 [Dipteronia sinensis]